MIATHQDYLTTRALLRAATTPGDLVHAQRRVRKFVEREDANPAMSESLVSYAQKRALEMISDLADLDRSSPVYAALTARSLAHEALRTVAAWQATMEDNVLV